MHVERAKRILQHSEIKIVDLERIDSDYKRS
jgi:hypothetical protein